MEEGERGDMTRWNSSGDNFYDGRRDFERRHHPDYEVDRYAISGPDAEYMDGYRYAERESNRRAEEQAAERAAEERREHERMEWLRAEQEAEEQAYYEAMEAQEQPQPEESEPDETIHEDTKDSN